MNPLIHAIKTDPYEADWKNQHMKLLNEIGHLRQDMILAKLLLKGVKFGVRDIAEKSGYSYKVIRASAKRLGLRK